MVWKFKMGGTIWKCTMRHDLVGQWMMWWIGRGGPDDYKVIQGRWNNNNVNKAVLLITG